MLPLLVIPAGEVQWRQFWPGELRSQLQGQQQDSGGQACCHTTGSADWEAAALGQREKLGVGVSSPASDKWWTSLQYQHQLSTVLLMLAVLPAEAV